MEEVNRERYYVIMSGVLVGNLSTIPVSGSRVANGGMLLKNKHPLLYERLGRHVEPPKYIKCKLSPRQRFINWVGAKTNHPWLKLRYQSTYILNPAYSVTHFRLPDWKFDDRLVVLLKQANQSLSKSQ